MEHEIKLSDVVALLRPVPENGLKTGQVGAVVEVLDNEVFEVEFYDKKGRALAVLPVKRADLLLLRYELEMA